MTQQKIPGDNVRSKPNGFVGGVIQDRSVAYIPTGKLWRQSVRIKFG